ncbi:Vacuolar protein sorting-associated protein atg6 [Malassezia psittaci]|uniref:Vacuolar protein sorting-associated protein atg6 n=1 Tax=Malassezia psittaci TaxID=1821823 RepID=A0AAF0FF10_9BASI|nr:Vacuolar protein sorting-associated protein atg6 [Malassezia psittaci]
MKSTNTQQAQSELLACDSEHRKLQQELDAVRQEAASFANTQAEFWTAFNQQTSEMHQLQLELHRNQTQAEVLSEMLNYLEQANAYLDVFDIGQDERGIATINGWHLGRLSTAHVSTAGEQIDWPEINAAWGQTAFLLTVLSRKLACEFSQYQIHPCGPLSAVERLGADHAKYELYGTNEWQIGRLFHSRRFDQAMIGVLACAKQLCERACDLDPALDLPYTIQKDTIGGASIRLQFNHPDTWSRATLSLLITLRMLLHWTIDHNPKP